VNFEKNDFQASLAKAKKANKLIFLDIYTGWCGPCLQFSKTVLIDVEVSKTLNSKFINLKYDAEVGEGIEIDKKYGQGYYPTILILDSDGKIIEDICKKDIPDTKTMKDILIKYK
jgi:thiol:disulfide interchange protein